MASLKLLNCFSVYLDHSYQNSTGKHPHKLLDIYVKERSSVPRLAPAVCLRFAVCPEGVAHYTQLDRKINTRFELFSK
jgi:hypothetical protein